MAKTLATTARGRRRTGGCGYRTGLRAFAQRREVADGEARIIGSKSNLLPTLAAASGAGRARLQFAVLFALPE